MHFLCYCKELCNVVCRTIVPIRLSYNLSITSSNGKNPLKKPQCDVHRKISVTAISLVIIVIISDDTYVPPCSASASQQRPHYCSIEYFIPFCVFIVQPVTVEWKLMGLIYQYVSMWKGMETPDRIIQIRLNMYYIPVARHCLMCSLKVLINV